MFILLICFVRTVSVMRRTYTIQLKIIGRDLESDLELLVMKFTKCKS